MSCNGNAGHASNGAWSGFRSGSVKSSSSCLAPAYPSNRRRACFESALEYSKTRHAFGKPIGAMQLTQQKLANMATSIVQGRLLAHRLGMLKDQGQLHPVQVSVTKRANVRAALDIARSARTILGANGITLEYPVARHMANLESVLTYEGTEEVHTLIIGKELTGENAFG